jgi:hypothetical protein
VQIDDVAELDDQENPCLKSLKVTNIIAAFIFFASKGMNHRQFKHLSSDMLYNESMDLLCPLAVLWPDS